MLLKRIYTSQDRIYLHHLKNILEVNGIECVIKNEQIGAIAGEIPLTLCWPELWVAPLHAVEARRIIQRFSRDDPESHAGQRWICEKCGEAHDAQFTACWKCQPVEVTRPF